MKLSDRFTWHASRTPLVRPLKALRRVFSGRDIAERRRLAAAMPHDPDIVTCAAKLNRDGFVEISDLLVGPTLEAVRSAANAKLARVAEARAAQTSERKAFWVRLLDEDMDQGLLPTDNPFVAVALDPVVLSILASALGELPQLDYVLLTLSEGSDAPLTSSQLWHRDYDDVRTIKLFIYLTEVADRTKGPFTFLPAQWSDLVGFTRRTHRTDEAVFRGSLKRGQVREITGPAGSAFFVETSRCLHMGSRLPPGNTRLLYTATFTTAPRLYSAAPPGFALIGAEDAVKRAVLGPRAVPVGPVARA